MSPRGVTRLAARLPAALARRSSAPDVLAADVARWLERTSQPPAPLHAALPGLIDAHPEFRNLFYYRLSASVDRPTRVAVWVVARIWRQLPHLDLACPDIGPGLTITHGFGTILTAERIGRDCWVHHLVTIGWGTGDRPPVLGDGVFIGVGASVLGAVTIGDGARIGAGAVVVTDVPAGATAVGVPARVLPPRAER